MTDFLFSVPSGEPVSIEPFHYAIVGQTQFSGKTTLIKRLSQWAIDQGFKVLIFDTKETEADYAGFGQEIPVCLRESKDSFVLIGLLESMFRRRLTPYYATLSRISEGAEDWDDIIERAKEKEQRTRSAWLKDACRVLYDLLERLKNETAKVETVPKLRLYNGINRMVINDFSLEAQQLIVKNSFEDLLRIYKRKTIGVLDEAFKFTPQGYSSAATRPIMQVMTQGAKTGLLGWISTQFLAVTDKGPLKACAFKFLGTQDHITEVKHTLDLIPEIRGKFNSDDIMKLKLGHWILVRKRPPDVRIVYALPLGPGTSIGRKVARGELTPEHVRDRYLKVKKEDEDLVYKERFEEERRKRKELEKNFADMRTKIYNEVKEELEKKLNVEGLTDTIIQLKQKRAKLEKEHSKAVELISELREKLAAFEHFEEALVGILQPTLVKLLKIVKQESPSEVVLTREIPQISLKTEMPIIETNEKTWQGRIVSLVAAGFFDTPRKLGDVQRELDRVFAMKGRPATVSRELGALCPMRVLERKQDSGSWSYNVFPGAKERIKEA